MTGLGSDFSALRCEALLYQREPDGSVVCHLCAHRCRIRPGRRGICAVRANQSGTLVTYVGEHVVAAEVEPIEKKPFFHFLPGSLAYSLATVGCNFHCSFCQNWEISQWPHQHPDAIRGARTSPQDIVGAARATNCAVIAYTYTEPTVFFELALQTSSLAAAAGLKNVFVTNGYMTREAIDLIAPVLDAANVDLKGFTDQYYRKVCGGTLAPVLETIEHLRACGIWVEVTTLVVPGLNDSDVELRALARWLARLDRELPWHVSGFSPAYKLRQLPPTPAATLLRAARIGQDAGLRFVYIGNISVAGWEDTICPQCERRLVRRRGFTVEGAVAGGRCPGCQRAVAGVWSDAGTRMPRDSTGNHPALSAVPIPHRVA